MSVVREELHRQANYLRTLESMNAKLTVLRDRQTSVEVLREQKRALEKRLQILYIIEQPAGEILRWTCTYLP